MTVSREAPLALSVAIPLHDEVESLPRLYEELVEALQALGLPAEMLFVDDGSSDGTWEALRVLRDRDERVRAIRLTRNFGQTAAIACGIDHARGYLIVTMDGDLQNDPADIPRLLAKLEEGYDIVCGWRHRRQDKLLTRRIPSLVANRFIGWITGVRLHDYGCSLKAYRAEAIKRTPLYAEFHRFIPALSMLTGALIVELKVNHRPRQYGRTKYNLWRTWKVMFDMVTVSLLVKFSSKPLRFFGALALAFGLVAVVCLAQSWQWYIGPYRTIPQVLPGVAVLGIWMAGHLLAVGFMAELCLSTDHGRLNELRALE